MPTNTEISNNPESRKRFFLFTATLLALFAGFASSCKNEKPQPPVPEKTMESVLVDIQLAETYSVVMPFEIERSSLTRFDKNTDSLYLYYSTILNHYGLSYDEFKGAMDWYKDHPDNMDTLLNGAIETFNRQKAKLGISDSDEVKETLKPAIAPGFNKKEIEFPNQDTGERPSSMHFIKDAQKDSRQKKTTQ